jgi:cell division septation protein DedD
MANSGATDPMHALLDSLVTHAESGSDDLAEALYWRAVLNERAADAERDFKRLVVDAPLTARVPEALLKLSDIEILRGRPASARAMLTQLLRDFSDSPLTTRASLMVARSYFEERDVTHACETVTALLAQRVPDGELKLQADELQTRCRTAAAANTPPTKAVDEPPSSDPPAKEGKRNTVSRTMYSVQIAAYDTRTQANALVKRLAARGWNARIDGERKPFRVRIGHYEVRADAVAALAKLKKQGQKSGFIAELDR